MTRKRWSFEASFKAKVAIAAVRGDNTTAQFKMNWRQRFGRAPDVSIVE